MNTREFETLLHGQNIISILHGYCYEHSNRMSNSIHYIIQGSPK